MKTEYKLEIARGGNIHATFDNMEIKGIILARVTTSHECTKIVVYNDGYFTTIQGSSKLFKFVNDEYFVEMHENFILGTAHIFDEDDLK